MVIAGAEWRPSVNYYIIDCSCGRRFKHPSNRWWVQCRCGKKEHIEELRKLWVLMQKKKP